VQVSRKDYVVRQRLWWGALAVLLAFVIVAGMAFWKNAPDLNEFLEQGRRAIERADYREARSAAERVLAHKPNSAAGLLLAAHACRGLGEPDEALRHCECIPDDGSAEALDARRTAGDLLLQQKRELSAAEEQYRRVLKQSPDELIATDRLTYILGLTGRNHEATPFRLSIVRRGDFSPQLLSCIGLGEEAWERREELEVFATATPDDPAVLIGLAREKSEQHEYAEAESLLQKAIAARPQLVEAHVQLGELLVESGNVEALREWQRSLPVEADQHPVIWRVRGAWALRQENPRGAVRCFAESVRLDPASITGNEGLANALALAGEEQRAEAFRKRAEQLRQFAEIATTAAERRDPQTIRRASTTAESLGLLWEAYGWAKIAALRQPGDVGQQESLERLERVVANLPLERTAPEHNPARQIRLADYPLPDFVQSRGKPARSRGN